MDRKDLKHLVLPMSFKATSDHGTFISLLLQNGESLAFVQKQAGHKSMDITLNVYGHLLPQGNREAVDRLDEVPQPRSTKAQPAA